jgi:hypothetical protein
MKERPILFQGAMVRAILSGAKTQTRRAIKLQTGRTFDEHALVGAIQELRPVYDSVAKTTVGHRAALIRCPYGRPGDRLWVRETALIWASNREVAYADDHEWNGIKRDMWNIAAQKQADPERWPGINNWKATPSIHMPRWASRITLEITDVRVERLQDISEADAIAEGAEPILVPPDGGSCPHVEGYRTLWESINGEGSWDANPWVWVVEFAQVPQA